MIIYFIFIFLFFGSTGLLVFVLLMILILSFHTYAFYILKVNIYAYIIWQITEYYFILLVQEHIYLTQHKKTENVGLASDSLCFDIILVYHSRHINQKTIEMKQFLFLKIVYVLCIRIHLSVWYNIICILCILFRYTYAHIFYW